MANNCRIAGKNPTRPGRARPKQKSVVVGKQVLGLRRGQVANKAPARQPGGRVDNRDEAPQRSGTVENKGSKDQQGPVVANNDGTARNDDPEGPPRSPMYAPPSTEPD